MCVSVNKAWCSLKQASKIAHNDLVAQLTAKCCKKAGAVEGHLKRKNQAQAPHLLPTAHLSTSSRRVQCICMSPQGIIAHPRLTPMQSSTQALIRSGVEPDVWSISPWKATSSKHCSNSSALHKGCATLELASGSGSCAVPMENCGNQWKTTNDPLETHKTRA